MIQKNVIEHMSPFTRFCFTLGLFGLAINIFLVTLFGILGVMHVVAIACLLVGTIGGYKETSAKLKKSQAQ